MKLTILIRLFYIFLSMKTRFVIFLSILAITVGSQSCVNNDFTKEINTIDTLFVQIDSLEVQLHRIDTSKVSVMSLTSKNILTIVESYYNNVPDELSLKDGVVFSNFKNVKKGVKDFDKRFKTIQNEISYTKKQLTTLRSDMENGAVSIDLLSQYIEDENQAVAILGKEMSSLLYGLNFAEEQYELLLPDIQLKMEQLEIADSIAW
ncbi:MAG: peptidoglycan hydrolase CwlO-like protein [Flavobacteriales bacterium]|jgi:peptidoglycan hydrolase CwlO-like protein